MNILPSCKHQRKKRHIKLKYVFFCKLEDFLIFRGFVKISSSICWRVMAMGQKYPRLPLVEFNCLPIFSFWAIMFAPDLLEIQSSAVKTRIIAEFPKKLESKNGSLGWRLRPGKLSQKNATSHLLPRAQRTPNQNQIFFYSELEDFPIWSVFEQLSSSNGWRVMAKNVRAIVLASADVKVSQTEIANYWGKTHRRSIIL